jgi:hypothetical protein
MQIKTADGGCYSVSVVETVKNDLEVYTLTTDHPTHNFLVAGIICKNDKG